MPARQAKSLPPSLLHAASRQHDLLRRQQLLLAGVSSDAIARLQAAGALHELHRGVYKVGTPTPSRDGRRLAAVYSAGPGSVLSHRDAAELHGLPVRGRRDSVDVTTKRGREDRRGIALHRVRRLHADDVIVMRGIRVTTVARTLIDLADVLRLADLLRAIHEADVRGRLNLPQLDAAIRRANGRDLRAIRAALDGHRPRSNEEIEAKLAAIADLAGLCDPHERLETLVDGELFELDRYYPRLRLCLEADGYRVHRTRKKFNSDRRRDRILRIRRGITVLRYTWDDVTVRERESVAQLAALVAAAAMQDRAA